MRALAEHRVRGRVWLVLAMMAGAGSVYVNDVMERREDKRELRRASDVRVEPTSVPTSWAPYGGGPYTPPQTAAPGPATDEVRATPDVPIDTEETGPLRVADQDAAVADATVYAVEDAAADAPPDVEDTGVVEDAAPEAAVVAAADAGVLYDPNVPYITPVYGFTVPLGAVDPNQPLPQPTGAGGTAATPSANMAGGTSPSQAGAGGIASTAAGAGGTTTPGLVGAGGTAAEPSSTMAGGTSIGATGAGGFSGTAPTIAGGQSGVVAGAGGTVAPGSLAGETAVGTAGGTSVGNAGAVAPAPQVQNPFAPPLVGTPFAPQVNPFFAPVPFGVVPVTPFVGNPFFFFVAPMGAFGVQ